MAGVFITRGMGIQIPAGGLVVGFDDTGAMQSSIKLQVSLDMCPYWLEIAVDHLTAASKARQDLLEARGEGDDSRVGVALEREFAAGMQALTASAISLDALYASVRTRISISESLVKAWRKKRTARHRQVAEVFRRAFKVSPKGFGNLSNATEQIYRFRDLAVHPPGAYSDPVLHPILGSGTEWRFVSFGYDSSHTTVRAALAIVVQLAAKPRNKGEAFAKYCEGLSTRLVPLVGHWKMAFGALEADTVQSPKTELANCPASEAEQPG